MLKKIGGLIKRHILLFIFSFVAFVAIVIMLVVFLKMTISTSGRYGDRLDGIEEVSISTDTLADISSALEEKKEVSSAKLRIQGKIVYVDISFTDSTSLKSAKKIASGVLDEFDEEKLEFYDFSFMINQVSDDEEKETWASAGSKNTEDKKISWIKS